MRVLPFLIIGFALLLLVLVMRLLQSAKKDAAQDRAMTVAFVANPANDTTISVRGWSREELGQILSDFESIYALPKPDDWIVGELANGDFTIAFPGDIQPKLLLFLVNYIEYPKNFNLAHRSIGVICRVTLTPAFVPPEASLIGKKAMIYVPADDTEFDLVYAKIQTGEVYKIPFSTLIWERVKEARMPNSVSGL